MNTKCNKEDFIKKSKARYGEESFDYSLVNYINGYTDIELVCKKHGKITIKPNKHLEIVGGCPHCSKEQRKKKGKMPNDKYKELVKKLHGDKYDLSKVKYNGMKEYVTATCKIHGDFNIVAYDFSHTRGCPKCGAKKRFKSENYNNREITIKKDTKLTTEDFIEKGNKIFNGFYLYDKVDLNNRDEKRRVCIICPEHGEFWQNPYSHLKGHGCSKCGHEKGGHTQKMTVEQYIEKANKIHNFKYDYTETNYKGCYEYIDIICPIHGKFSQKAYLHLNGHGCPKCANKKISEQIISNTSEFIEKAKHVHYYENNDYSKVIYKGAKIPVTIICENGHEYLQMPNKHLSGHGCPYCTHNVSNPEKELSEFIKTLGFNVENNNRRILTDAKEIDLIIPSKKVAIEYDGLRWHSENMKPDKLFHLNKTIECNKNGLRLIHIFEDEWIYKREIVESRLNVILGGNVERIYARKCIIKEIDSKTCKEFLNKNHIQGGINSSVRYGLYHNNELVSVMAFCKPRKNLGQNSGSGQYELLRFCNKLNTVVIGGASKLFNFFVKDKKPKSVISYADRRWNTGNVYESIGFEFSHFSEPNYFYVIGQKRYNRFSFRKDVLVQQGFDPNKSEHEIMLERGIYRIYDCGTMVYKWFNKD